MYTYYHILINFIHSDRMSKKQIIHSEENEDNVLFRIDKGTKDITYNFQTLISNYNYLIKNTINFQKMLVKII